MKKLLLFLFALISFTSYAQLDREHWFAPMMDEVGNSSQYQSIYMSTNETIPFRVDIYNNNVIVGTATISKNNPVKYSIPNSQRSRIITTSTSDLFQPVAMGFYLKGAKPFFASLRFSINNHGEIQTSKGTAGLGTEFRAVMAPITVNNGILNFMNSIMATEDNTRVTITDFNPNVTFADFVTRTQFNFTLNKGQSYIIEGTGSHSSNYTGYIGAKIVSDKPVVIANGNFNGQYAGNFPSSSDILMDQGVPIDKLGQEFVLMKGNGDPSSNMEKGLILATENNTEIYLNNGTVPAATLNAGQYFLTPNAAYINQGSNNYNMFIRATKNVYVYQLLAGANNSSTEATGGFNYIPPLNCYLPKKIDEIGKIEENEYSSNGVGYSLAVPTKLNIITETGASIKVFRNGSQLILNTNNGPFPVLGNSNWVTYSIPNITGNIAVNSTAAVTAGISAGNDAVGYGGYFAGFSATPLITKTEGDCLPGVKLEVTEGFDNYEWLEKVGGIYVPAQGINNTFEYTPTQAGIYAVKVKQGSCPEIQTKDFKFYNCTTYTNYDFDTCTSQTIIPTFALSSQTVNIPTIVIDTPPTKGTVIKNPDGTLTYTANPNATGTDTFKFSFCGTGIIPDCETVQATIHLNQIEKYDVVLYSCSATTTATYDLTSAAITPDPAVTKKYFTDAAFTNQIPVTQLTNYISAPGFIFVQLSSTFPCSATATIELKIKAPPVVTPSLYTATHCDEEIDGIIDGNYKVDLTTITPTIVQNPTSFTVRYFATQPKAISGLPADVLTGNFLFTGNTSVWIRVDSPDTCPPVIKEVFLKIGTKAPLITLIASKIVCDLGYNNTEPIDLADYIPLFSTTAGTTTTYFNSLADAQNNTPTITAAQTITGGKTFYYRLNVPGFCNEIGTLNIILSKGTPTALLDSYIVCDGDSITLNAENSPTYTAWLWKKGTVSVSTTRTAILDAGVYTIEFTNTSGCVFTKTITVTNSPKPIINTAAFTMTYCDSNFDGISEPVNFNTITPIIVTNFAANSSVFTVKYYLNAGDRDANNGNTIPNLTNFTFNANTTIYFRVDSPVCPLEKGQIDLKFNNSLILTSATVSTTICDNNLDGTETISLANYRNLFTTETGVSVRYFATLADAQNNTSTINVSQPITGNKTFYYRFKKAGLCDAIGTLNIIFKASTPTALLNNYLVCQGESITLTAENAPTYTAWLWKKGTVTVSTTRTATLNAGVYTVSFTNDSGCVFTKTITVTNSPKPTLNIAVFNGTNCDDNFDGVIVINLKTVTTAIVPNSNLFIIKYYTTQAFADAGGTNNLPDNWSYTDNTSLYVRVEAPICPFITGKIDFKFGNNLPLLTTNYAAKVCDDDFDGIKSVNLADYKINFTTDSGVTATYHNSLTEAQNSSNPILPPTVTITNSRTFYLRFHKNNFCDVIGKLDITIQKAVKSDLLVDQNICQEAITTLDPGPGFDGYIWSTGETSQTIEVPVGNYWVDLLTNGCTYRQNVSVKAVSLPVIMGVEIQGGTVTILVTGGNPPYQYSLNGSTYQTSNVFTNIPSGDYTVYVISADQCLPITTEINILRILNVITPNDDGKNDVLNYTDLLRKDNPFLQIFDRYGVSVFKGDKNNNFSWDGKIAGKAVATGSYWYVLQWQEPGSATVSKLTGWVLVKSRE